MFPKFTFLLFEIIRIQKSQSNRSTKKPSIPKRLSGNDRRCVASNISLSWEHWNQRSKWSPRPVPARSLYQQKAAATWSGPATMKALIVPTKRGASRSVIVKMGQDLLVFPSTKVNSGNIEK